MAKALNRSRMRDTRILVIFTLLIGISCTGLFAGGSTTGEIMDIAGYFLIAICAIGRVYTTAFIGGHKNQELITYGPYSLCRNPLYSFSILGAIGIGLMTNSFIATIVIATGFIASYTKLIHREEEFLVETFGDTFRRYQTRIPKLIPSFKLADFPAELIFKPLNLNRAVFDALWWFAPLPLFELAEHLKEVGLIKPTLTLF